MKKVFFGSSDPGGANVIAAVARRLPQDSPFRAFTDAAGYRAPGLEDRYEILGDGDDVSALFDRERPDVVFTATSLRSPVERTLLAEARRRGVRSAAVVDHWTSFAGRFDRQGGVLALPDTVFVIDETAARLAAAEGIPTARIGLFGHPHFHDASSYVPASDRGSFWTRVGVRPDRPVLVFLSDCLSEVAGGAARAQAQFGYHELEILDHLLGAIGADRDMSVVVKPHPMESTAKFDRYLTDGRTSVVQAHLWETLAHADYVAGMFSSALVEAAAIGKQPLRIEIGAGERNLLPVPAGLFFDRVLDASKLRRTVDAFLRGPREHGATPFAGEAFTEVISEWLL